MSEPRGSGERTAAGRVSRPAESEPVVWIDSHCHPQMIGGGMSDGDADAAIARARDAGVVGMVVVGTDLASSREAVELAQRHPDVRATVGLHPHDASQFHDEWADLERLAEAPGVVAVGETGFDLHYRHSSSEAQEHAFREQIRLAHRLDLALVIHSREAWDQTFEVLTDEGPPARTVFHCFTGGEAEANGRSRSARTSRSAASCRSRAPTTSALLPSRAQPTACSSRPTPHS